MNVTSSIQRRGALIVGIGGGVAILVFAAIWFVNDPLPLATSTATDVRGSDRATAADDLQRRNNLHDSSSGSGVKELRVTTDLQVLNSIANNTHLQLLDSDSLTLNRAILDLLQMNASQGEELNILLSDFVMKVQTEELAHAYVAKSKEGGEEIVVAPFKRSGLLDGLRKNVSQKFGGDVGSFFAKQALTDRVLALNDSELRLYIERDGDGTEVVVFNQKALRRDAVNAATPINQEGVLFSPTYDMTFKTPLTASFNSRYKHLFSAVENLPREK